MVAFIPTMPQNTRVKVPVAVKISCISLESYLPLIVFVVFRYLKKYTKRRERWLMNRVSVLATGIDIHQLVKDQMGGLHE